MRPCVRKSWSSTRAATRSCSRALLRQFGEHSFGYTIPNLLIDHAMRNPHVPPGFWRGVNINQNAIFMECFMDELAQAAGQDELEFRRKLLGNHPRNLAALNAVAEKIGWGKPAPAGVHRGLAHMKAFNAYVAAAAEVSSKAASSRSTASWRRPIRATPSIPAQIDRQVAGSFVYGLSALFYQECTVKDGRIVETNFDTYDFDADRPDAEGRVDPHADRRQRAVGRRRRADHLRGGTGGDERVLQGDGQAHPLVPAEEPRHQHGVSLENR